MPPMPPAPAFVLFFVLLGDEGVAGEQEGGDGSGVFEGGAVDLGGGDDAAFEEVGVFEFEGVEAEVALPACTLETTTPPCSPAFSAMVQSGTVRAERTTPTPILSSSPVVSTLSSVLRARMKLTPPPGTMPSSTAARVAWRASSTRAFFSLSSASEAAPTLICATPPASLARRSWSFSRS